MKKLFILSAMALITLPAFSQEKTPRTIKYIIRSGFAFSEFKYENKKEVSATRTNTEFYVSALANIPIQKIFSVQSGLSLVGKGNQLINKEYIEYVDLLYIEVPAILVATFPTSIGKFSVGAGPYLGIGIDGGRLRKSIGTQTTPTQTLIEDKIRFSNSANQYEPIDFGMNFLLAYEFKNGFGLTVGYSLGMTNIYDDKTTDQKIKNSAFSAGLSFNF